MQITKDQIEIIRAMNNIESIDILLDKEEVHLLIHTDRTGVIIDEKGDIVDTL